MDVKRGEEAILVLLIVSLLTLLPHISIMLRINHVVVRLIWKQSTLTGRNT